jgi:hypothetical protein
MASELVVNLEHTPPSRTGNDSRVISAAICKHVALECQTVFGQRLQSIVLTGSLSREEATFKKVADGWELLGDVDCLLVLQKRAPLPHPTVVDALSKTIMARLLAVGIHAQLGLSVVRPSYLRALPHHIFTFELRSCGQVILGDPAILCLVPNFPTAQISRDDAWRTLCHRIIELLACIQEIPFPIETMTPALLYAALKLYLDMATSYLVFLGCYAPTYAERARRLQLLAQRNGAGKNTPFSLREFSRRVSECTAWKLCGPPESDQVPCQVLEDAIADAQSLWRWESIQLAANNPPLLVGALCQSVARQQAISRRLRGWMSLSRRTNWSQSWKYLPRWLKSSFAASPRYLVYRVALEAFWQLPTLLRHEPSPQMNLYCGALHSLLPARAPVPKHCLSHWHDLVADVTWNYKQFLVGTLS